MVQKLPIQSRFKSSQPAAAIQKVAIYKAAIQTLSPNGQHSNIQDPEFKIQNSRSRIENKTQGARFIEGTE